MNRVATAVLVAVASLPCVACEAISIRMPNGPYAATIAPGLAPRLTSDDAVRITIDYLDAQRSQVDSPHIPPHVDSAVALAAADARTQDGCIPMETSTQIVWVTKGTGDYLNLAPRPWSSTLASSSDRTSMDCTGPGPAGTLVIDDATGSILGVFPSDPCCPRPTPYRQ